MSRNSNRSAALLKLRKDHKAMGDAETAIRLRPDWEKGYFRKGAVLEAEEKLAEVRPALTEVGALAMVTNFSGIHNKLTCINPKP